MTRQRASLIHQGTIHPASAEEAELARKIMSGEIEPLSPEGTSATHPSKRRRTRKPEAKGIRTYKQLPRPWSILDLGGGRFLARFSLNLNPNTPGVRKGQSPFIEGRQTKDPIDFVVEFTEAQLAKRNLPRNKVPILHAQTVDGKHLIKIVGSGKYNIMDNILRLQGKEISRYGFSYPAFIEPPLTKKKSE